MFGRAKGGCRLNNGIAINNGTKSGLAVGNGVDLNPFGPSMYLDYSISGSD